MASESTYEELREIEHLYKTLIEGPLFAVIIHDVVPYYVSKKAAELFGYNSPEDLINSVNDIEELFAEKCCFDMKERRAARYETQETSVVELTGLKKDGTEFPLLAGINVTSWKGEPAIQCTYYEITALKQAEEALRQSELKYKTLTENSIAGIFIHQDDKYVYVNDKFAEMHGYQPDELLGINHYDLIHPDQRELIKQRAYKRIEGQPVPKQYEIKRLHKNGQVIWHEIMVSDPIIYEGKHAIMGHEIDINERKHAEEAKFEVLARFSGFAEASQYGMGMADLDGHIVYVNSTLARMLGEHSPEDCLGKHFPTAYYSPKMARKLQEKVIPVLMRNGYWHGELEILTTDGRCVSTDENYFVIRDENDRPCYLADILTDITERKKTEQALRESEERYRSLFELSPDSIVIWQDEKAALVNPAAISMFGGKSSQEIINMSIYERYPVESHDKLRSRLQYISDTGLPTAPAEYKFIRLDGQMIDVETTGSMINYKNRPAILSLYRDISDKKKAQEAIRESEEKYRLLFEMESDVVILIRCDDEKILDVNNAGLELYGYTREELMKMKTVDLSAEPEETRRSIIEKRDKVPLRYHRKKDGTVFPVEISRSRFSWNGQEIRMATMRDISQRIEAEKQRAKIEEDLRQAQKMEAIGTLAGGIAHDFNNILGIILGNAELAIDDVPDWNPASTNLNDIKNASLRAKDVIRQLLSFSRKTTHERKPIKIAPHIKDSIKFIRSSIPSSIEIRENISAGTDAIAILGDATQIHQVMINLCTNAAHAMETEGGLMEISLTNKHFDETNVKQYQGLKSGLHVILTVNDTGMGIEPDIRDRIFDPYFTTKEVDKGTGMGLSVVHGIVKNHEGAITIESEPGKGTTINVIIPIVETVEKRVPTNATEVVQGGNERILFIDDEPEIIIIGQQILERLGYQCVSKENPVDALRLFQLNPTRFDLVITDMTMPQMTGDKLVEEILNIRPDTPIILCTGYSDKIDEGNTKELGIQAYVMKPIVMNEIARIIRQVLDQ